ncbi:lasso RiPP family leader peptide-containing protein [Goodfellowiella coeruleoviolacea]|uniref:Lasso RiPP family leader peptide-containing protein n=1 Tax=Goodfellowiella coeruleoviolacea TaxID=334858 RepID=A0AAE3GKR7_9PSEU|nr:lasso RiPP family leader peptide-containing protein [Goodfellowiella coeruleoviolacea]MCP2170072.1 hypothetical protein [Goodfellowiella coeruleoviolacea]
MQPETACYEPPALVEVGDFAQLTQDSDKGNYVDGLFYWFGF